MPFGFIDPNIWVYLKQAFHYVYLFAPVLLPIWAGYTLFNSWVDFRRAKYWQGMGTIVLEIKLPREITKSPKAMELVLGSMHQTADESNWYWKYWRGQTRAWFSLEMISEAGKIRFFIWARKKYQNQIESHFYSQYPGVEVYLVEDYAKRFYYDPGKHKIAACEWELSKPDPYPIKTYVDYGLEDDPKEEHKIDPMTSMLEYMGSLPAGHTLLVQYIIRAHVKEQRKPLTWQERWEKLQWSEKTDAWQDEAKKEINKIIESMKKSKEEFPRIPTKGEAETIAALERSVSKLPFDVGMRTILIGDKDKFNALYQGGMLGAFKQFGSPGHNGFKIKGWSFTYSYPWHKWLYMDEHKWNRWVLEEFKFRRFFFSPFQGKDFYSKPMVLNAEELATIYHLPGEVAATPTLERVPSKKAEAPSNLPI